MAAVALVVGKEHRTYTDKNTGELKSYRAIHVVWEGKEKQGLSGNMVETISIPADVDFTGIELQKKYHVLYGAYGRYARCEGLEQVKA